MFLVSKFPTSFWEKNGKNSVIQDKCKKHKTLLENYNHKFQRKNFTPNESKFKSKFNNPNIEHINNSKINFFRKLLILIFEIIINLIIFCEKLK
jgi:hypothetical protein